MTGTHVMTMCTWLKCVCALTAWMCTCHSQTHTHSFGSFGKRNLNFHWSIARVPRKKIEWISWNNLLICVTTFLLGWFLYTRFSRELNPNYFLSIPTEHNVITLHCSTVSSEFQSGIYWYKQDPKVINPNSIYSARYQKTHNLMLVQVGLFFTKFWQLTSPQQTKPCKAFHSAIVQSLPGAKIPQQTIFRL